ncbi:hypothetical protein FJQ98_16670 [Lysinibacillus agricola]|uniref:Phage tail protein n=1 Tax=Lysinibacillus agricola TaxID=2590012 RepID=A0ABX7ARL3_9BACI|nr:MULTISPECIES: hypothetical protein [Lysinibacillus]KOS61441.1 hypothetical protein AN161_17760 [Lysinibacillus sp. FJAT-14222]QQP10879.1 hypothetical protein FJQ98_16670 [Lysinibacillus agricola]
MVKKYGIVRLDLMAGHVYHYDADVAIENGVLAEIDYTTGKIAPTTDATKDQVLVASVTNLYDSEDESDFINEAKGMKVRTYEFEKGDIFTTTQVDLSGTRTTFASIAKGDYAYGVIGGKFAFDTTAPTTKQVFRVIERTVLNGQEAVALQVEQA